MARQKNGLLIIHLTTPIFDFSWKVRIMRVDTFMADTIVRAAMTVAGQGPGDLHQVLGSIPVPIFVTSSDGVITYFNRACVPFAGRTPTAGKDKWCVTWKL